MDWMWRKGKQTGMRDNSLECSLNNRWAMVSLTGMGKAWG